MSDAVLVALISATVTLLGVIINNRMTQQKFVSEIDKQLSVYQARTDERIDELAREVRDHNNYARRLPVVEAQMSELTRRVQNLERPSA